MVACLQYGTTTLSSLGLKDTCVLTTDEIRDVHLFLIIFLIYLSKVKQRVLYVVHCIKVELYTKNKSI